jgi:hypothetical protein
VLLATLEPRGTGAGVIGNTGAEVVGTGAGVVGNTGAEVVGTGAGVVGGNTGADERDYWCRL